jgi:hypothetical protein
MPAEDATGPNAMLAKPSEDAGATIQICVNAAAGNVALEL